VNGLLKGSAILFMSRER